MLRCLIRGFAKFASTLRSGDVETAGLEEWKRTVRHCNALDLAQQPHLEMEKLPKMPTMATLRNSAAVDNNRAAMDKQKDRQHAIGAARAARDHHCSNVN